MICVSIGRSRHKQVIAEHKHLVEKGAKLVELRLDYISTRMDLRRLVSDRPCPVVVTCRRPEDGGKWTGTEDQRVIMLREAIALGVEYIDLEDDVASSIPRFGDTKRIISHHNFRNTPPDLKELHAKLVALDADIVKIATMAQNPHDNLRILDLIKTSDVPTVAMCMGDIGTPSRILGAKYGAPFTYSTFHHERALAPGQLSFDQMQAIYHYDDLNADSEVFGVIADPIGHSLSPQIHNAALRHDGLNAVYVPFRVPADDLHEFINDATAWGIKGLSVTIPHKETVAKHLTKASKTAMGIKAINTVVFPDGEIYGGNTDCQAAMDSLEEVFGKPEEAQEASSLKDKIVLVLGAGGVSRAIIYGLTTRGARVTIASRSRARAQALAEEFDSRSVEWGARHNSSPDIIINGTPIGMHPNVDDTPFNKLYLKPSTVVFDTVYNPESTLLVKEAREKSCRVVTGVEMFLRQAGLQYAMFTGKKAPIGVMRDALKKAIGPVKF